MEKKQTEGGLEEMVNKNWQKIVVGNDFHIPFHDEVATDIFLRVIKDSKPDKVVLAGDVIDFYNISSFDKNPVRRNHLQEEIDETYKVLKDIKRVAKDSDIIYLEGNHEDRFRKYLWQHPELSNLREFAIEKLLNLKDLNIKYVKYGGSYSPRKDLLITHGDVARKHSGYTAKAMIDRYGVNVISGHCFDEKTEILTMRGWLKRKDLESDDLVATLNKKTLQLEWQRINEFHDYDDYKELVRIKTNAIDLLITDKHGLIIFDEKNNLVEISAEDVFKMGNKKWRIPCSVNSSKFLNFKEDNVRLAVQILADGSVEGNAIRFHLKKERKIERLKNLLEKNNINYSEGVGWNGAVKIRIKIENLPEETIKLSLLNNVKHMNKLFVDLKPEIVLEEYGLTDGCKNSAAINSYQLCSYKEREIDLLQQLFITKGYRATKNKHRGGFTLTVNTRKDCRINQSNISVEEYDGKVWCVNVDNGTLVIRRNGKVCVTQNTHRGGTHYVKNRNGTMTAQENFCLCNIEQEYITEPNWQQGFCVIDMEKFKGGHLQINPVLINNGIGVYNGKVYK